MLHGYLSARKKKVNKFFWEELLPIVKSFFTSLWNQERPKVRLSCARICVCVYVYVYAREPWVSHLCDSAGPDIMSISA